MSFQPENKHIADALHKDDAIAFKETVVIPIFHEDHEHTKNYTFSLQPSVRKNLDILANKHNFKSASSFLNELLKNI